MCFRQPLKIFFDILTQHINPYISVSYSLNYYILTLFSHSLYFKIYYLRRFFSIFGE